MTFIKDKFFGGAEKKAGQAIEARALEAGRLSAAQLAQTEEEFQPFLTQEAGLSLQKQQALSGALGPEAQQQAFADFQEDPGTQFLREQGLRLIGTGAGATGGLGGGERLRELTRFSQGLALQDLSNRFNRLGVTARGEEGVIARRQLAAGTLGGLRAGFGAQQTGLLGEAGRGRAEGLVSGAAGLRGGLTQLVGGITGGISGFQTGGLTGGLTGALEGAFGV